MEDPFPCILIGEILEDGAPGGLIELHVDDGRPIVDNIRNDTNLLIIANKTIKLLNEDIAPKLKRTIPKPINPLIPINNIKANRDNINSLNKQVIEIGSFIVK